MRRTPATEHARVRARSPKKTLVTVPASQPTYRQAQRLPLTPSTVLQAASAMRQKVQEVKLPHGLGLTAVSHVLKMVAVPPVLAVDARTAVLRVSSVLVRLKGGGGGDAAGGGGGSAAAAAGTAHQVWWWARRKHLWTSGCMMPAHSCAGWALALLRSSLRVSASHLGCQRCTGW